MSRNIILFLCAFLATIGVSIGIFWLLGVRADDLAKIVRKDTPQPTVTAPTQPEQPKAEEPARPEPQNRSPHRLPHRNPRLPCAQNPW